MKSKLLFVTLTACWVLFSGCNYELPLTAKPTRRIEERLIGDWITSSSGEQKEEILHVRRWDDSTYAVAFDNDLYRASHSDLDGTSFLSVQDLNSSERKYLYMLFSLSADGQKLGLQTMSAKVVPEKIRSQGAIQKLVRQNIHNPELLGEVLTFTRITRRDH
jgi:hypothetical protein